mgnify:CR=1 FL=1
MKQPITGVMLNAYPDSIGEKLEDVINMLKTPEFDGVFSLFYVLPTVFNSDLDRGFSVIDYNLNKDLVFAKGGQDSSGKAIGIPEFTENGSSYSASEMTYNFKTKKGTISEVTTQEGEGYVKGDKVKKTATDVLYIKDGYYTTCNLDHPHYSLATSKLKVIPFTLAVLSRSK